MTTYVCVCLGAAFLAMVFTPLAIRLAGRLGAVDRPGPRAVHKRPIPRIGGLAIFSSAMCLILAVLFLDNAIGAAFRHVRTPLITMLGAATFIFLIGLMDDLKGLPARCKLLAEVLAAAALCFVGVRIDNVALTEGVMLHMGGWGCVLTLFWVVGITNAVNLSDGLDGLAAGISVLACATIAAFALHGQDPILSILMLALVGSLSGFLFFNFNPARVFMGDCGSLFLGFTIAAASVMCAAKSATIVGLTLPALALGIPIFDTLFAILRRFLEGRSLFAPDRSHFHHRLLELGLRQRQAVLMIYLITALAAGFGLFMLVRQDVGSLLIFGGILLLLILLFHAVGVVRLRETCIRLRAKLACAQQERQERRIFEQLQLCMRQVRNSEEWWQTICQAAQQLDLAWISLHMTNADGGMETSVWRRPVTPPGFTRMATMSFPLLRGPSARPVELEIAVLINGSLESANHRADLFSRLVDESVERATHGSSVRPPEGTTLAACRPVLREHRVRSSADGCAQRAGAEPGHPCAAGAPSPGWRVPDGAGGG